MSSFEKNLMWLHPADISLERFVPGVLSLGTGEHSTPSPRDYWAMSGDIWGHHN